VDEAVEGLPLVHGKIRARRGIWRVAALDGQEGDAPRHFDERWVPRCDSRLWTVKRRMRHAPTRSSAARVAKRSAVSIWRSSISHPLLRTLWKTSMSQRLLSFPSIGLALRFLEEPYLAGSRAKSVESMMPRGTPSMVAARQVWLNPKLALDQGDLAQSSGREWLAKDFTVSIWIRLNLS
jgi:hypothetical protein